MTCHRLIAVSALLIGISLLVGGCRATQGAKGESPAEKQATIKSERQLTLDELYAMKPEVKDKIAKAAGYAYFSNVNVNVFVMSSENGYGVVHDNKTGKDTYMKMAGAGVGLGMGAKDYRAIFVFTDLAVMQQFIEKGMSFGGQTDVAAKSGEEGAAAGAAASSTPGMEVYQLTEKGLALQATVQGTKYWRDDELNK
jgi:lipid-binding SYLF domain-containing protein